MRKQSTGRRLRRIASVAFSTTLLTQNFAWALCSDGSTFPTNLNLNGVQGYLVGSAYNMGPGVYNNFTPGSTVLNANNWSPTVYTGTANGIWMADNSTCESNDCANFPITGGGHQWTFDQGSTLCQARMVGSPAGTTQTTTDLVGTNPLNPGQGHPTAWVNPPAQAPDCVFTDVIIGGTTIVLTVSTQFDPNTGVVTNITRQATIGQVRGITDVPYQGEAFTPTCDPTMYSPPTAAQIAQAALEFAPPPLIGQGLPSNTYLNHLGCSLSTGAPTEQHTADSYLFVAGIHGGMFVIPMVNTDNTVIGHAGKGPTTHDFYGAIPLGQKLTTANISPDGRYAMASSLRRSQNIFACQNPLGDPEERNFFGFNPLYPINAFQAAIQPDTFVGSIATNPTTGVVTLTVNSITAGAQLQIGQTVSGVGIPPGVTIAALGPGATGFTGTYILSLPVGTTTLTVGQEALTSVGPSAGPDGAVNPFFFRRPATTVPCILAGANGLAVTLTNTFGGDYQPYFGGRRVVNTFNATPGSNVHNPQPSAWPQCVGNSAHVNIYTAFNNNISNGCVVAVDNGVFDLAGITQPQSIIRHVIYYGVPPSEQSPQQATQVPAAGQCPPPPPQQTTTTGALLPAMISTGCQGVSYLYTGPIGGAIMQFRLVTDWRSGTTLYSPPRNYFSGLPGVFTGVGIDEGMKTITAMDDSTSIGAPGKEFITQWALCEDLGPQGTP